MKTKHVFTLIATAALMCSCSLYKNYERPADISTDKLYGQQAGTDGEGSNAQSLGDQAWRTVFTDPTLQALIEKGLTQNTDMRTAALQIEEAEAALQAAKLAFLPNLVFGPQGSLSGYDWGKTVKAYTLPVSASWQIDIFGSLRNAKKRSQMQLLQSQTYKQAVQVKLVAAIANYYYTLAMLDEQLRISEQTVVNWKKNVDITKALMEAGESNDAAVSQSEANYYAVCTQVVDLKQQIREIENSFSTLLAETPGHIQRGTLTAWQAPRTVQTGVPAELLARRPDVKAAEYTLAAAFYATNEARAAFYPGLTLSGTIGWTNSEGMVNPGKWIWNALGSLTQPLFMNGKLRAQLKVSKAQQEEAKLAFQQALIGAGAEVNTALSKIQNNKDKESLYASQIASLERAVKSTQALMLNSPTNYLQVLTAQQSLLAAQLSQVSNRFSCIQGTIELYQALGGGTAE